MSNPTRKEVHAFQRGEMELTLGNGMTIRVPLMNVVGAILLVLTPAQRRQVAEICVRTGTSLLMTGPELTLPARANGGAHAQ